MSARQYKMNKKIGDRKQPKLNLRMEELLIKKKIEVRLRGVRQNALSTNDLKKADMMGLF